MKLEAATDCFRTNDLPLASALVCLGYYVASIKKTNPGRVQFCFKKTETLINDIEKFWNGEIRVEPKQFSSAQKALKARIYSE